MKTKKSLKTAIVIKDLSTDHIYILDKIGKDHGCSLYLPPLANRLYPFFEMTKMAKKQDVYISFIYNMEKHRFSTILRIINDRIFMEVIGSNSRHYRGL